MGVYIQGMEMPKKNHTVTMTVTGSGEVYVEYYDGKPHLEETIASYTAIPVLPHGRLIDAEWLTEHMKNKYENGPFGWNPDEFDVLAVIEDAPTIIEAEEAERAEWYRELSIAHTREIQTALSSAPTRLDGE